MKLHMTSDKVNKDISRTLTVELFDNLEAESLHTPYSQEKALLECVREGDTDKLFETYSALPDVRYGKMSSSIDPLKQLFYGCIANTTLVTRAAIDGGLEEELAFTLSDIYIKKMEQCRHVEDLYQINEEMAMDFTSRVAEVKSTALLMPAQNYSIQVSHILEYIHQSRHKRITLDDLSLEVGLSAKYISALFKKETGDTISDYILKVRIEEAKNLLTYSDYTSSQISEYLAFNSQSYFISVFKKSTGMTPQQYKKMYARQSW